MLEELDHIALAPERRDCAYRADRLDSERRRARIHRLVALLKVGNDLEAHVPRSDEDRHRGKDDDRDAPRDDVCECDACGKVDEDAKDGPDHGAGEAAEIARVRAQVRNHGRWCRVPLLVPRERLRQERAEEQLADAQEEPLAHKAKRSAAYKVGAQLDQRKHEKKQRK